MCVCVCVLSILYNVILSRTILWRPFDLLFGRLEPTVLKHLNYIIGTRLDENKIQQ